MLRDSFEVCMIAPGHGITPLCRVVASPHQLITATSAPVQTISCCFLWSSGLTRGPCLTFETELEYLHQAVFINLIHI